MKRQIDKITISHQQENVFLICLTSWEKNKEKWFIYTHYYSHDYCSPNNNIDDFIRWSCNTYCLTQRLKSKFGCSIVDIISG